MIYKYTKNTDTLNDKGVKELLKRVGRLEKCRGFFIWYLFNDFYVIDI